MGQTVRFSQPMKAPTEQQAICQAIERLAELTDTACQKLPMWPGSSMDALLQAGPFLFVVEWKSDGAPGLIALAVKQILRYTAEIEKGRQAGDAGALPIPVGSPIVPLVRLPPGLVVGLGVDSGSGSATPSMPASHLSRLCGRSVSITRRPQSTAWRSAGE